MLRPILVMMFVLSGMVVGHAQTIQTSSTISDVTIYPGLAVVTRTADVTVPAGDHTILFDNIIPEIDDNTLTVKGQGQADVKIFGASVKRDYLTESANERVKELTLKIQDIDDAIIANRNQQIVLTKRQEYVDSIKFKAGEQLPKELITKMPAATELQSLGEYLTITYTDIFEKSEQLRLKERDLTKERVALQQQLNDIQHGNQSVKRSIGVDVQCVKPGKLTVNVSYAVNGVNWTPIYDARVAFQAGQVELSLFGQVMQNTGEDWSGVKLTISTARPTVGGRMPELSAWYLAPVVNEPVYPTTRQYMAKGMVAKLAMSESDMAVNSSLEDKLEQKAKAADVAYAQVDNSGVSAVFTITKPVDIKSDGAWQRVPITVLNMPATFDYATTPKFNNFAYLKSKISNKQEATLLPGAVNIFLDGSYVGNSSIDKAIGPEEEFDLYLGVDEGVTVKRKLLEQKSDDTMLGSIPSANRSINYKYKITVENYKNKAIAVNVFDQVPVSQDDKIKVKNIKFTPEPTRKDVEDRVGVMSWLVNLNQGDKQDIVISYAVEYPRNLDVSGL